MIISRSPFRVSLLGGGTDHPDYFKKNEGGVISFAIKKYSYLTYKPQPQEFKFNYRIRTYTNQDCNDINEITHNIVRESMKYYKINSPCEIIHFADYPSNSGLGSSSAFTSSFVAICHYLTKNKFIRRHVAEDSIYIERDLCKENGGWQDQIASVYGGFTRIDFNNNGFNVKPLLLSEDYLSYLQNNMLLVHLDGERMSNQIQDKVTYNKNSYLDEIFCLVNRLEHILNKSESIDSISELIKKYWFLKQRVNPFVNNEKIQSLYDLALANGALSGKIMGAGSSGFFLFVVPEETHFNFIDNLKMFKISKIKFDFDGVKVDKLSSLYEK